MNLLGGIVTGLWSLWAAPQHNFTRNIMREGKEDSGYSERLLLGGPGWVGVQEKPGTGSELLIRCCDLDSFHCILIGNCFLTCWTHAPLLVPNHIT